ncbi:MAG: nicotinamidase/pyrazinamidase [Rhodospirillaceae bacterium]|nr:nicotinamidase/pyrazinamidase [Rhodospirillaceae bacterium]|tara:strand:- start:266 stop:973 length:708 start_codon:yes stop_codon:yes gene_type:complete
MQRRDVILGLGAVAIYPLLSARELWAKLTPSETSVLLVVDVQNCFLPGGTLAVPNGDEIIPVINSLGEKFQNIIFTQDWHTQDQVSFASNHPGKEPFETVELSYGTQVLWPDHCVQGTHDARLASGLNIPHAQLIIRKGYHSEIDSYSAFVAADRKTKTGLTGYMRERGLQEVYVCGLATDFCVNWSAMDARQAGMDVWVIEDACRAIDLNGSLDSAWKDMEREGVQRISSADIQ